jgi:hypothetical protein
MVTFDIREKRWISQLANVALGGLVVIVLAIITKVRRYKPGPGRWISKGDKNP